MARRTGVSRPIVIEYLLSEEPPKYGYTGIGPLSILQPYKPYVRESIEAYNLSGVRILEEIRARGYLGGYTVLKDCCQTLRNNMRGRPYGASRQSRANRHRSIMATPDVCSLTVK